MSVHKSMQGKSIDMAKLAQKNELTPAVSNIKVNARGDKLGPNGVIIERREETMSSYYENKTASPMPVQEIEADSPPDVIAPTKIAPTKKGNE